MRIYFHLIVGLVTLFSFSSYNQSGSVPPARQTFTVHVPDQMSIGAPRAAVSPALLTPSSSAELPTQIWAIQENVRSGVHVSFATEGPFRLLSDPTVQRDVRLEVSVSHESKHSVWLVTDPMAETDYHVGKYQASVHVESMSPGQADLGVRLSCLAEDGELAPHGTFLTTVVGTISEN